MVNSKYLVLTALTGFILSCLTGLIFGASWGILLLRALICAIVFGGAAFGIQFAAKKFLVEPDKNNTAPDRADTGSMVDITLEDEDLQSENDVSFDVGNIVADTADVSPETGRQADDIQEFSNFQPFQFGQDVSMDDFFDDDESPDTMLAADKVQSKAKNHPAFDKEKANPAILVQTIRTMLAGDKNT
ncbi:MAG: hypothetical protein LBS97_06005 [Treponema sp.]|nr:hypothetical protein [Treponema sp.]